MTTHELHWRVNNLDLTVRIEESKSGGNFQISGQSIPFRLIDANYIEIAGKRHRFYVVDNHGSYTVWLDGHTYFLQRAGRTGSAHSIPTAATGEIRALMPGKVLRLEVAAGDTVREKQTVGVMESMKMETPLHAPKAGRVVEVRCQPGQVVEMGELLMVIE
jgi:acetyl/propionyl-CoA carboxylase alpha subunit